MERVIAIGESQSAMRLTAYIIAVDAIAQDYDGFFVHAGSLGIAADASGPMRDPSAPPEPFREDLRVPVLCFEAETDLMVLATTRRASPTTTCSGLWEVAGTSHADVYTFVTGFVDSGAFRSPSSRAWTPPTTAPMGFELEHPINTGPQHYVAPGRARALRPMVTRRMPLPRAPPRSQPGDPATSFVVDEHGIAPAAFARRTSTCRSRPVGARQRRRPISFLCGMTIPFSGRSSRRSTPARTTTAQVRRGHRCHRGRRLLPRSRRPRDQGDRRRALPRLVANRRRRVGDTASADASWV